ncbi:hypothetical protein [Ahrensia sp. R2A130]|nr:hypothetical protein [Ahrensia sp. R2A130]EFL89927.1 XRE family transcriptional regulator [Ahrensia sp. R2A130]
MLDELKTAIASISPDPADHTASRDPAPDNPMATINRSLPSVATISA